VGWVAIAAGVLFGLSVVLLAAFFRTRDERMDVVATWGFVAFAVASVPVMLAARDRIGAGDALVTGITAAGIVGVGVLGLAEAATGLRLIDFRRVALATTIGFVLFLLWIGGLSATIVGSSSPALTVNLGWLGLASILAGLAVLTWIIRKPGVLTGDAEPSQTAMFTFFLPLAGIIAWLVWLGLLL
jgi:hypothetical protein